MRRFRQLQAKVPKVTQLLRIVEAIAHAGSALVSIPAFIYFSNKPSYGPVAAADNTSFHLTAKGKSPTTCSANFYSSQSQATNAADFFNSLNLALLITALVHIVIASVLILLRLFVKMRVGRLRVATMLQLVLQLLQMPLFFSLITISYDDCLKSDLFSFAIENFQIIFFSGIALYIGGLLVTAIVAATRKLGECALQVVLGVCLLSGFFYALAFVGSILSIFFAFFSVISVVTGFIALILTVQEVKELAGPYSSHI